VPTRKQRRRTKKERRHEYETVWVDEEGNELEDPPDDHVDAATDKRANGKPKAKTQPQRGGRTGRVPPAPSWSRAARRSLILGGAIFALFYILGSKNGNHNIAQALGLAAIYTILFIPFSYTIDRFTHNRHLRRADQQADKRPQSKKR
jgi:hypothetical protein